MMNRLSHNEYQALLTKREEILNEYLEDISEETLAAFQEQSIRIQEVIDTYGAECLSCRTNIQH